MVIVGVIRMNQTQVTSALMYHILYLLRVNARRVEAMKERQTATEIYYMQIVQLDVTNYVRILQTKFTLTFYGGTPMTNAPAGVVLMIYIYVKAMVMGGVATR